MPAVVSRFHGIEASMGSARRPVAQISFLRKRDGRGVTFSQERRNVSTGKADKRNVSTGKKTRFHKIGDTFPQERCHVSTGKTSRFHGIGGFNILCCNTLRRLIYLYKEIFLYKRKIIIIIFAFFEREKRRGGGWVMCFLSCGNVTPDPTRPTSYPTLRRGGNEAPPVAAGRRAADGHGCYDIAAYGTDGEFRCFGILVYCYVVISSFRQVLAADFLKFQLGDDADVVAFGTEGFYLGEFGGAYLVAHDEHLHGA